MKKCRFCAEEIKDEAIICRFCGRAQDEAVAAAEAATAGERNRLLVPGLVVGAVVLAGLAAFVALGGAGRGRRTAILPLTPAESAAVSDSLRVIRDSFPAFATLPGEGGTGPVAEVIVPPPPPPPPPEPDPPATGEVADIGELKISPGQYHYYGMEISDTRPCRLRGRVETTEGGRHDTDVLVLDVDGFTNFQYDRRFQTIFAARRIAAVTLDVPLPGPGTYYLVLSNRFSAFTGKVVHLENVHWECAEGLEAEAETDTTIG